MRKGVGKSEGENDMGVPAVGFIDGVVT